MPRLVLLLLFVSAGCEARPREPSRTFAVAGTMQIDLPVATEATRLGEQSLFTLEPEVRTPRQISVLERDPGTTPGRVRLESPGGSGGTEYELRVTVERCGAVLEIRCSLQSEDGWPSMKWCERAIASLRCGEAGGRGGSPDT